MIISKLLYEVVSKKSFSKIRYAYYTYRKSLYKPLSEEKLRKLLT